MAANEQDDYYERKSYEVLEAVAQECKDKPRAYLVKAWKQAYPFGDRKGRKYKIWNKLFNHARRCFDAGLISYD